MIMSFLLLEMIIGLVVFSIVKTNVHFAEIWTRTFGRYYTMAFSKINEVIPFSLTEFSAYVVIISCIMYLGWGFSLLGNKRVWDFIHRLMMIALITIGSVLMYNLSVGAAYHRAELPLETYSGEIKKEDFKSIATYFVEDYNSCVAQLGVDEKGEIKIPYTKEHMIKELMLEFDKLDDKYYNPYVASPKAIQTSGLMTANSIVGMYFGVLGEVNYNTYSTNAELPFYIAHELCHAKGVMREDDAQLLAFYVLATSDDPLFRYSAYWMTLDRLIDVTRYSDDKTEHDAVVGLISEDIWKNNRYVYEHWKGKTVFSDIGDKLNDWYLRTFGQKNGTSSYNDTPTGVDPSGTVIHLSKYQGIYFKLYYDKKG